MYKVKFKAKVSTASKETKDKYYMIGLSKDKYETEKYLIFQKPYDLGTDEDPHAEQNGIFCESNGDQCFNKVEYVKLSPTTFEAVIFGTLFSIDISEASITKKFQEYAKEIFGDKISISE